MTAATLTPATPARASRATRKPRAAAQPERNHAREAVPRYHPGAGVGSFRHGLPDHEQAVIDAALGILSRYLREPGALFDSPHAVRSLLRLHLGAETTEHFAVLYLDSQNRAIALETPFTGTLAQTSVYPRELVRAALLHNASAVILAHNHPSGNTQPSRADEVLTQTIKAALALIDVRVLDHMIVTGAGVGSMAEMGLV
jgi:DNA repair protein RadC